MCIICVNKDTCTESECEEELQSSMIISNSEDHSDLEIIENSEEKKETVTSEEINVGLSKENDVRETDVDLLPNIGLSKENNVRETDVDLLPSNRETDHGRNTMEQTDGLTQETDGLTQETDGPTKDLEDLSKENMTITVAEEPWIPTNKSGVVQRAWAIVDGKGEYTSVNIQGTNFYCVHRLHCSRALKSTKTKIIDVQIGQPIRYDHTSLRKTEMSVVSILQQVENLDAFFVVVRLLQPKKKSTPAISICALPVSGILDTQVPSAPYV